jgi:predicted transcriptional regulator
MACLSPNGKPTESGKKLLRALGRGIRVPEDVAKDTGLPLFRVRSGLRELAQAGLVIQNGEDYELSPQGNELIDSLP